MPATPDPLSTQLILHWHGMLLAGIRDEVAGRFRRAGEWVRVGGHLGANPEFTSGLISDALVRYREQPAGYFLDPIARSTASSRSSTRSPTATAGSGAS